MPKLGGKGYIVVGDAARMCMNLGYTIRGMDLAIESGMCAAEAVNVALRDENMDRVTKLYEKQIKASWLRRDMKLYKNMPKFLATNPRIFNEYPAFLNNLMRGLYTLQEDGTLAFDFAGCLECGTCRVLCGHTIVKSWKYPRNAKGVEFRQG